MVAIGDLALGDFAAGGIAVVRDSGRGRELLAGLVEVLAVEEG